MRKFAILLLLSLAVLTACKKHGEGGDEPSSAVLAFPGADGGGKYTVGGRGGEVYHITSLEDNGAPGTLRYAVTQPGKRTVVFDVAGVIHLVRELDINHGALTIAGQTAPGDGICIADYSTVIKANDVIIRFVHFRMGDVAKFEGDALSCCGVKDIIVDHCSFSWSTDECVSCYGNTNFTLQYCIISESLRTSVHDKGKHGYGGIWGGTNATFHHNLLAHHDSRNPRFDHDYVNQKCAGPIDYVNNVVYNWGGNSSYGGEGTTKGAGGRKINMVANYYKYGPATKSKTRLVDPTTSCADNCIKYVGGTIIPGKFFLSGNYMFGSTEVTNDNWQGATVKTDAVKAATRWTDGLLKLDHEQTAEEAYVDVLAKAGCSLVRDAVDERIVREVQNGNYTYKGSMGSTGGLIDSQKDVGGWPEYKGTSIVDSDKDGIPDAWEEEHGLDRLSYKDGAAKTLNTTYTNLEVYLNSLVERVM